MLKNIIIFLLMIVLINSNIAFAESVENADTDAFLFRFYRGIGMID